MPGGTGSFSPDGCPVITVEVSGALPGSGRSVTVLVDTGFGGFLSLPILDAFPIGLILHSTTTVLLADGSEHSKFTCLGAISFGGETKAGPIIIEPVSTEALVGMEFLKEFNLALLLTDPATYTTALFSSDLVKKALAAVQAKTS